MLVFVLRRVLGMVPLLLGATFVIFAAVYALPGDPIRAIAGPTAEISPPRGPRSPRSTTSTTRWRSSTGTT